MMKLYVYLTAYTKFNSKSIKDLKIQTRAINSLKKIIIIREKLHGTACGKDFLNMMPKAETTKAKIAKLYYIKIKNFWASNNTI